MYMLVEEKNTQRHIRKIDEVITKTLNVRAVLSEDLHVELVTTWIQTHGKQHRVKVKSGQMRVDDTYTFQIECTGTVTHIRSYKMMIASLVASYSKQFEFSE